MTHKDAIDTYVNGNISDFIEWLKTASKIDILDAIEYYAGWHGKRHEIINMMRLYLSR